MGKKYFFILSFLCLTLFYSTPVVAALLPGLPISYATVEDYNMDGWLDIALASNYGLILVYLGQPDGGFSEPIKSYCGGSPNVMSQADFNRDGRLDLVVGDSYYGKIKFMLNVGNGKFKLHEELNSTGVSPVDFAILDINGDGRLDISLVDKHHNCLSIAYGNKNIGLEDSYDWFDEPINYSIPGGSPSSLIAEDCNGDGKVEFIVPSEAGNMLYLFELGEGGNLTWAFSMPTGNQPTDIAIADLNLDGCLDIIVANRGSNNIEIYYGKCEEGAYRWELPIRHNVGQSPSSLTVADFNSDGCLDIAVSCEGENAVYLISGAYFFFSKQLSTGAHPIQVEAADFDRNGEQDLITVNRLGNTVTVLSDEVISKELTFKPLEVSTKINDEDKKAIIIKDAKNRISISMSLTANDCRGMKGNVYIIIHGREHTAEDKIEETTRYVTTEGLIEEETPLLEDWPIQDIPEMVLWTLPSVGFRVGYYEATVKIIIPDYLGFEESSSVNFVITGPMGMEPCLVDLKVNGSDGPAMVTYGEDAIKATYTLRAGDYAGMPAGVFLWIAEKTTGTPILNYCREGEEYIWKTPKPDEGIKPFIDSWPIGDVTEDILLFHFPPDFSLFPPPGCYTVHYGIMIHSIDSLDVSYFDTVELVVRPILLLEAYKKASYRDADNNGHLNPGETIIYTIEIINYTDYDQPNDNETDRPEFVDDIPENTTYESDSAIASHGEVKYEAGKILWDGSIPAGEKVSITFKVRVDAEVAENTDIINQGHAYWDRDLDGINEEIEPTDDPYTLEDDDVTILTVGPQLQPNISVSPESHDFGEVEIGESSAPLVITISNTGSTELNITAMTLSDTTNLTLDENGCGSTTPTIAPGGSCTVLVTFKPESEETFYATLTIEANDPDTPSVMVLLSGKGIETRVPDISISPESHDFGEVEIGNSSTQTIMIYNMGTADLLIGTISDPGGDFSKGTDNCSGKTLASGSSCTVDVKFEPTSAGEKKTILLIPSNDPDEPVLEVPLTGKGTVGPLPEPDISVSPESHDFGDVEVNSQSPLLITISNKGTSDLNVTDMTLSDTTNFALDEAGCGSTAPTIAPGGSCKVLVTFKPKSKGTFYAILIIESNDLDTPSVVVLLTGKGVSP